MYKTCVIELRPKLHSANVFITLNTECMGISVSLHEAEFTVYLSNNKEFTIKFASFKAQKSTLSSIKVSKQYVSFRFFTSTIDNFGSFKTELLKSNLPNNPLVRPCEVVNNLAYMIQCKNCSRNLIDTKIIFKKILPLPDNTDSSDWFCHGHNSNDFCLEPQKNDLFYGNCFVHLHKDCLSNYFTKNDVIVCKFCFNWLGVVEQNATKLWFNTVKFVDDKLGIVESTGLSDVCVLIKNLFRNQLFNSLKTMLRFKVGDGKVNYLLLWILEKQLKVVFNDTEKDVAKILFKFFEDDSDGIFEQWHNDYRVEVTDVSKVMMVEVLKHLHENNKVFPKEFSVSNDFLVSYLFMYD